MKKVVNTLTPQRKALLLALLLALLVGLYYSGKWGVAAVSHALAMNHFNYWQRSTDIPDQQSWLWVEKAMLLATKWDAFNADYKNDLARFYMYTAESTVQQGIQREVLLQYALSHFREAAQLRPSWPIVWSNIVLTKYSMNQIDVDFEYAMSRAEKVGAATRTVQEVIVFVGIARWFELSVGMRKLVLDKIHDALNTPKRFKVIKIMRSFEMKDTFCRILPWKDKQKFCK